MISISISLVSQIEVKALNFYSDENKDEDILSGNVEIVRSNDILTAEEVIIYTNKNRKPTRYEVVQDANFKIVLKGKTYKGSGDEFIYDVARDIYEVDGNAFINELESNQKLYGDRIIVDERNNVYRVESRNKEPARFIFDLE